MTNKAGFRSVHTVRPNRAPQIWGLHSEQYFCVWTIFLYSGVGTYVSGTARAVPLLKVGRLVMHFAVPRPQTAYCTYDVSFIVT